MKICPACKKEFEEGLHGFEIVFKNQVLMMTFDDQELCGICADELSDLVDNAVMNTNVPLVQNMISNSARRKEI